MCSSLKNEPLVFTYIQLCFCMSLRAQDFCGVMKALRGHVFISSTPLYVPLFLDIC